jgi:23S rRNA (adenine2503-C2)-methyltransferase
MNEKKSIYGTTLETLKVTFSGMGLRPFVASQVLSWIYKKNVTDVRRMTNISNDVKLKISQRLSFDRFKSVQQIPSEDELAVKLICELQDAQKIECVVLKEKSHLTLCISSQAGCPVDCKFCLTGVAGFKRNLDASEIVMQVLEAKQLGFDIKNLVFMGMGEPLLNYDQLFIAIEILNSDWGYNIGARHITISTSGYLASINRLIKDNRFVNLAFSVGSAFPVTRNQIMPIEARNPILKVARRLHDYLKLHNRKLTLEYTLLQSVNDSVFEIEGLINLAKYLDAKINLINLNPHEKIPFKPIDSDSLSLIKERIQSAGARVTVRFKKGQDIAAACGQLGESIISN